MNMNITHIYDSQGLTILHHTVLKLIEGKTKFIIDYARNYQQLSEEQILKWINQKTYGEEWTALHYAAFSSNIDATYCLIDQNADIYSKNKNELSMLHVAAQGDSPAAIYLFYLLGLNINEGDKRGCTPVHWACYSCSEISLSYLLALKPDINIRDKEGLTPLHLAVRSVGNIDSCRPVRSLLIKGAKIDIKDNFDKIPADYIEDAPEDLQKELEFLLIIRKSRNPLFGGRQAVKEVKNRSANLIFYYVVFAITFTIKFLQIYTRMGSIIVTVSLCVDFLTLIIHIALATKNPGFIKNDGIEFMSLLEAFDPQSLCPECKIIRTGRSRHCIICKQCVERYDHHCPWINNCVGIKNHNLFLSYLIVQSAQLVLMLAESIIAIVDFSNSEDI